MKLYLSIIGIAVAIISAVNIACGTAPWYYIIIATLWCAALQFGLDGLFAILINKMPDRWFGVTYAADKPVVVEALKKMTQEGKYPDGLWK